MESIKGCIGRVRSLNWLACNTMPELSWRIAVSGGIHKVWEGHVEGSVEGQEVRGVNKVLGY